MSSFAVAELLREDHHCGRVTGWTQRPFVSDHCCGRVTRGAQKARPSGADPKTEQQRKGTDPRTGALHSKSEVVYCRPRASRSCSRGTDVGSVLDGGFSGVRFFLVLAGCAGSFFSGALLPGPVLVPSCWFLCSWSVSLPCFGPSFVRCVLRPL